VTGELFQNSRATPFVLCVSGFFLRSWAFFFTQMGSFLAIAYVLKTRRTKLYFQASDKANNSRLRGSSLNVIAAKANLAGFGPAVCCQNKFTLI